jgi:tRNA modification GTPase
VLTPEGRGAIAVVRVWGPGALGVADAVFRPATRRALLDTAPGVLRFGRVGAGVGDEVVAVVCGTGDGPEVEIQCHGGPAAVGLVVESLVEAGAERRQPSAWVRHDARSVIEAEARVDLARAPTLRTAEVLLEQAAGALRRDLDEVARLLASNLEPDLAEARRRLERLEARGRVGLQMVTGWSVVLAGRPNVGKSALLNALAGYERAIVAPTPGTTRDVVSVPTAFDGWPVELSDTAGLRDPGDPVEAEGVTRARARQARADLTVLVLDRSEPLTPTDFDLLYALPDALLVANKADLSPSWPLPRPDVLAVSAARGDGVDSLASTIARRLVPDPPEPGSGAPFRPGHLRRIVAARDALLDGDRATAVVCLAELIEAGGGMGDGG